jgi:RNA polymerase sigma factor (TIGR02999 family)
MYESANDSLTPSPHATSGVTAPPDAVFARVYESLKGLAHTVRRGRAGDTLDTTALVHEAFLKLSASGSAPWKDEAHFFAVAARAMRQILVDAARRDVALKRGGADAKVVSYDDAAHMAPVRPAELLALDAALERLNSIDPRRALVVEHRVFAGLSTAETAALLGVSTGTVERDWRAARAWLSAEMADAESDGVRTAASGHR